MKELIEKYLGKNAIVSMGGLQIEVKVTDVKNSYGKDRFLITPVTGSGAVWVEYVSLIKEK